MLQRGGGGGGTDPSLWKGDRRLCSSEGSIRQRLGQSNLRT